MKPFIAAALSLLLVPPIPVAQAQVGQARYQYLVDATNRMMDLNSRADFSPKDFEATSAQACSALSLLLKDEQFGSDLAKWRGGRSIQQRKGFKRDVSLFVNAFLLPENKQLRKAGLSEESIRQISGSAAFFKDAVDANSSPKVTLDSLQRFRNDVCGASSHIHTFEARKRAVGRWAVGLGVTAMIVFDLASTLPSAGVSAASVAIGSAGLGALITLVVAKNDSFALPRRISLLRHSGAVR